MRMLFVDDFNEPRLREVCHQEWNLAGKLQITLETQSTTVMPANSQQPQTRPIQCITLGRQRPFNDYKLPR